MKEKQIAIVGISLRFPGANTIEQFWHNLMSGVESVEHYDHDELIKHGVHPKGFESEQFVNASARLEGIDQFDNNFFNYSPKDAALLDPQQRLLLECGYEALEDAGIPVGNKSHEVGVFAGAYVSNYLLKNLGPMVSERSKEEDNVPYLYQCETDHLATNLAYRLNLTGPSISVQSWCTTAFSALFFASRAIANGDCSTALVGAANICIPQEGYFAPEGGLWSISGKTRSFDKAGDGCVSGSGVATVILKDLDMARKDGNQIYALLRGVAVNNDGKSSAKLGYHGATVEGQYQAITKTFGQAGIGTEQITYLEANGLATPLADRMEIKALSKVFEGTNTKNKPWLGSLKPNIGHLLSASGMAALIKACLICKYKKIPPLINHESLSKVNKRMVDPNFRINYESVDLTDMDAPIICGMNSFGIGGSNAHAIVEEVSEERFEKVADTLPVLLSWSAKTPTALKKVEQALKEHLISTQDTCLADLSYTLNSGKGQMTYRETAVVCSLEDFISSQARPARQISEKSESVWLFNGYGDTYPLEKFKGLYYNEPVFKNILDQFFEHVATNYKKDFRSFFFNEGKADLQDLDSEIKSNIFTIVLNYAYGKTLMHWGISPAKMVGVSNGEYTAACLAGVFSFEEMVDVVICQSEVIATLPKGNMLTVIAEKEQIAPLLEQHPVDLGGTYLPNIHVISGATEHCESFCEALRKQGIDYLPINASYAFHSGEVAPILGQVESLYETIQFQPPRIPLISTVTGAEVTDEIMEPSYWSRKMRDPVLFMEAMAQIDQEKVIFVECGPENKFSPILKYLFKEEQVVSYPVIKRQSTDAHISLLEMLGNLWQHGLEVDWDQFYASKPGQIISLPHYPFEKQSFWLDYSKVAETQQQATKSEKLPFPEWFHTPSWKPLITTTSGSVRTPPETKVWLIFTNGEAYSEEQIVWLREKHQQVVVIRTGEYFKSTGLELVVDPYDRHGMKRVFDWLSEKEISPDHVLYFWCLGAEVESSAYRVLAYTAMIELVRGIDRINAGKAWSLFIVTNDLLKVHTKDALVTDKSLILGPVRTIPNEYSNVTCQLFDQSNNLPFEELMDLASSKKSRILAERHGTVFQQYLEPIPTTEDAVTSSGVISEGTYVLTGGLGGIGQQICKHLLERSSGIDVILIGRTPIEEVQSTRAYCSLKSLASKRANQLSYYPADISVREKVTACIHHLKEVHGQIRGVFHLAGIQGGGMISFNERQGNEPVFDAKIEGTKHLVDAFRDDSLDFFVMSSSSSAWFGFFGLLDYSTANAYMDQLAQQLHGHGSTKFISINWDMWATEGMATGTGLGKAVHDLRAQNATFAIDVERGLQALEQILHWDLPQIAVLTRTPEAIEKDSNLKQEALNDRSVDEETTVDLAVEMDLETSIIHTWERIFERSDIKPDDNFFQLGGHSLSGVMFINKMKSRFPELQLSLNEIFDYPTPKIIASLIEERTNSTRNQQTYLKDQLWEATSTQRLSLVTEHLVSEIEKHFNLDLKTQASIPSEHLHEVSKHLYFNLKEQLELPIYAYEVNKNPALQELSSYIVTEFEAFHQLSRHNPGKNRTILASHGPEVWNIKEQEKIKKSVFVCSAPRSGSTLLRLMLAGHSQLFAPPELWLLGSQSMREWSETVPDHVVRHGGINNILQTLGGMSEQEAHQQIQNYINTDVSCFDVFKEARSLAMDKWFIDKTPNYYKDPHVFHRIESGFEQARFIHLIRHPYATMDSIYKNRIYSLYDQHRDNPIKAAEHIWYLHNQNIRQFIESSDPSRSLVIRYEDLVTQPETVMRNLCSFLEVDFEERMIKPYDSGAMIAGDGDPNILSHDDIDPKLAAAWKNVSFDPALDQASIELAAEYQYDLSSEKSGNLNTFQDDLVGALDEQDLDDLLSQLA